MLGLTGLAGFANAEEGLKVGVFGVEEVVVVFGVEVVVVGVEGAGVAVGFIVFSSFEVFVGVEIGVLLLVVLLLEFFLGGTGGFVVVELLFSIGFDCSSLC